MAFPAKPFVLSQVGAWAPSKHRRFSAVAARILPSILRQGTPEQSRRASWSTAALPALYGCGLAAYSWP